MERVWVFDELAVSVTRVDFLDPAVASEPDARERGVRIEVAPVRTTTGGSIYASDARSRQPAICRIDFLESAPGAADRMHWHPTMQDGEPGERTFEKAMPPDPVGWLITFLHGLGDFLARSDVPDAEGMSRDVESVRATAREIGAAVEGGLAWARTTPWPDVEHDERGMAVTAG